MGMKLTSKIVLEKEFSKGFKGYNTDEVDQFLDDIIQDYDQFESVIAKLQQENQTLREQLANAPKKQAPVQMGGTTNFDILKRISNLEKHVFGSKMDE